MTEHPMTEDRVAQLWDSVPESVYAHGFADEDRDIQDHTLAAMRAAFDAGREHVSADPHHDPRPWQDCTRDDIRKGDLVEAQEDDILHVGVAHRQDDDGDWWTKDSHLLTYGGNWPLRRIPAPTPPAVEVELPSEHPAHITDVEIAFGTRCAYMALGRDGRWLGVDQNGVLRAVRPHALTAFTLPDGTRVRRDGDHKDGTPRFVEEEEDA